MRTDELEMSSRKGLLSAVLAVLLGAACYLWENVPLSYGESFDNLYFAERFIQSHFGQKKQIDDGLFINVGYDKAIGEIDLYGLNGLFIGHVDITDRQTLDRLLARLEADNTYKYILLDVRFEKEIKTPYDSTLFSRIYRMRDIVVATHHDIQLASPLLKEKAALSDFKTTITSTGFTRYQFIQGGQSSIALKMYEDLTGNGIHKIGPLYVSDRHLCYNSLFIRIPEDFSENLVGISGNDNTGMLRQRYYDCGPQIDEDFPLGEKANGKIVIIGDFVNDVAGTYMGEQPNPYLTFLSYKSLIDGRHKVKYLFVPLLLVYFFAMFLSMLLGNGHPMIRRIIHFLAKLTKIIHEIVTGDLNNRKIETQRISIGNFFWNFVGYSVDMFVISLLLFLLFNITFSVFIPSTVFSVVSAIVDSQGENGEDIV